MWIEKKGSGFNKFPLPIIKELTAEEFINELGNFASFSEREFRQVIEYAPDSKKTLLDIVRMINVYCYRYHHVDGVDLGLAMGNVNKDGKYKATFWMLGDVDDWKKIKNKQSAFNR